MIFNLTLCLCMVFIYLFICSKNLKIKNKQNIFLKIVFFILFILVATREKSIGNDTISYLNLFKLCGIKKWNFLKLNTYYEKGYITFNILLSFISTKPRFFMWIMAAFFNYSVYKFIKENSENYLLSTIMYINLLFFYQSMTMMRQFMALSIVLLFGYNLIKERKFIKYVIVIAIATLFHSTAIVAIFIYPIYNLKYTKKNVVYIILSAIFCLIFLDKVYPLIASLFNRKMFYFDTIGKTKLANIMSMLIYLTMYIFSRSIMKKDKVNKNSFYLFSLILAVSMYLITINMAVLSRAAQYYAIFSIIALPNIIENNISEKRNKIIIELLIVFCLICYSSTVMIYRPEWNTAFNYKSSII